MAPLGGGQSAVSACRPDNMIVAQPTASCTVVQAGVSATPGQQSNGASGVVGSSPSAEEVDLDEEGHIEVACTAHTNTGVRSLVKSVIRGLKARQEPEAAREGMGGTYFFPNELGRKCAIFKPCDEEPLAPANPKGYVGRASATRGGRAPHKRDGLHRFRTRDVHAIGILDIRLFNTDRHAGNILHALNSGLNAAAAAAAVASVGSYELIPIDHGFCLPEALEAPYFEWLHWPQACLPFDDGELAYIAQLDAAVDIAMLQRELPNLRPECLRVLEVATTLCSAALPLASRWRILARWPAGPWMRWTATTAALASWRRHAWQRARLSRRVS
ncbi:phosphatidylinositol 3 and 4-kinase-domain-containing protein [Scenedesmus sp. NREL 46B-D3]|nr:phosphatidylinositol 3 and 4-kinase-domain-containing protein [Scenedesmus sp. NREL 46B-D3]